jgi:cytidyltransferase-like protein
MTKKIVAVSGYYDPLHVGHLENFELAKELGDELVVILNNDEQAILKKGGSFMSEEDRMKLISALSVVDRVVLSIDEDLSVCKTLALVKPDVFAQGGDRHFGEVPESSVCKECGIEMVDGLGKKIRASSEILEKIREAEQSG